MNRSFAFAAWLTIQPLAVEAQNFQSQRSPPRDTSLIASIRAAEDARASTPEDLDPILLGIESRDPAVQQIAVRALGRLERATLVPLLVPMLAAQSPDVRAEAANALGQSVSNGGAEAASWQLVARLDQERDPTVRGMILQTLGRLPYTLAEQVRIAEEILVHELADSSLPAATMLGAARGIESLVRRNASTHPPERMTIARLRRLARFGLIPPEEEPRTRSRSRSRRRPLPRPAPPPGAPSIRRLATAALISAGGMDGDFMTLASSDPDNEVRRLAMTAARMMEDLPLRQRATIVAAGLRDASAQVRYEALRAYGSRHQADFGCEPVRASTLDPDDHVALLAIDLLGNGCATGEATEELLMALVGQLPASDSTRPASWHKPSHAFVALARVSPQRVESMFETFMTHPVWQVRMYAVSAATRLPLASRLRALAYDEHHNVRQAAIAGLQQLEVTGTDSIFVAALEQPDYQLVRTAARAVTPGVDESTVVPALLAALKRLTAQRRETSRDARMAVIEQLASFRGVVPVDGLRPYLRDFDSAVANRVAEILTQWTGAPVTANPTPLPRAPLPTNREIADLDESSVFLYIRGGGPVRMRLYASEAPTNVARFVRLSRAGYFDGLTFHRVAPNFVIQGGSPGANEYAGAGLYTRDEVTARMHARGTVGISTRGRDTGDAQIFINLVDNMRLDHNYTIIGEIVGGMDVMDAVIEGAVIERVVVREQ
jgi:cyclophilin family peptidyl-prolyl cis-trans isomerase/HEAT repeat protein